MVYDDESGVKMNRGKRERGGRESGGWGEREIGREIIKENLLRDFIFSKIGLMNLQQFQQRIVCSR